MSGHAVEVIGVVFGALFTAILQNLDVIKNLIRPKSTKFFNGQWVSKFREYNSQTRKYEEGTCELLLRENSLKDDQIKITGTLRTSAGALPRTWNARGVYHQAGSVLILNYRDVDESRNSMGTIVLKGKPEGAGLRGYWLGHDPEKGKIVAGPYIMARTRDILGATINEKWIGQPCYELPDIV